MSVDIYCPRHQQNEHLSDADAEALIHGLYAHWWDQTSEPAVRRDPALLAHFCPTAKVSHLSDPEMYSEHVEQMRRARFGTDLSDIPADTMRRAREGFRRAYEEADAICRGERDPLSSR